MSDIIPTEPTSRYFRSGSEEYKIKTTPAHPLTMLGDASAALRNGAVIASTDVVILYRVTTETFSKTVIRRSDGNPRIIVTVEHYIAPFPTEIRDDIDRLLRSTMLAPTELTELEYGSLIVSAIGEAS